MPKDPFFNRADDYSARITSTEYYCSFLMSILVSATELINPKTKGTHQTQVAPWIKPKTNFAAFHDARVADDE